MIGGQICRRFIERWQRRGGGQKLVRHHGPRGALIVVIIDELLHVPRDGVSVCPSEALGSVRREDGVSNACASPPWTNHISFSK